MATKCRIEITETCYCDDDARMEDVGGEKEIVKLIGNTANTIDFEKVSTSKLRINFRHALKQVAVSEIECY